MWILAALLVLQFVISRVLSTLNLAHLRRVAADPPAEWIAELDTSQFEKVIAYTDAKNRLGYLAGAVDLVVVLAILFSGLLPAAGQWAAGLSIGPVWQGLLVMALPAAISYLSSLPFDLLSDFGVERKFGFSTITLRTWLMDQLKSVALMLVLGIILGGGLLLLLGRLGWGWWLPAWILLSLFQLLMGFVAPALILPLFNKFEPLRDEELREQVFSLARQAGFPLGGVYQVDASLRSTHLNAYFVGLGKARRIALFDTLLEQFTRTEILAVLAHEIGHWKKRHIQWMLVGAILAYGAGLALTALLLDEPWLYRAVGASGLYAALGPVGPVAAIGLYVLGILFSPLGLLASPIVSWLSRRNETEADAYSLDLYGHPEALVQALIKLNEKNLSNLFPHPLVVAFHYSHPPLFQRIAALRRRAAGMSLPPDEVGDGPAAG